MFNLLLLVIYSNTCCSGIYIDILLLRTALTLLFNTGRSRILFRIFFEIGLGIAMGVGEHSQHVG